MTKATKKKAPKKQILARAAAIVVAGVMALSIILMTVLK